MGTTCFSLSMVESIERCSSLKEVQEAYVVDLFERNFVPSSSCYGKIIRFFRDGWRGGETSAVIMHNTLMKIKKVFQEFFAFIESKSLNPSRSTRYLCRLTYFPWWQNRILRICNLFEINFPSCRTFEIAQRFVASSILQDMTGVQVPWNLLEGILKKEILDEAVVPRTHEIRELDIWIQEVQSIGMAISPVVLLRVFEEVSIRVCPEATVNEHEKNSFFLAWKLYKYGFKNLLSKDIYTVDEIKEILQSRYSLKMGEELTFHFPSDLQLCAYSLIDNPSRMLLTSLAPLTLGIWFQNEVQMTNVLPLLHVYERSAQFQFIIVDKLLGTFQGTIWEKSGIQTKNDKLFADSLVILVKKILDLKTTPELNIGQFFVALNRNIYVLNKTKQKFPYFSIQYVENFVRQACQFDSERMAYIMKHSMFHENEYSLFFIQVLKRACTKDLIVSPQEIKRCCELYRMFDPNLASCAEEWNKEISQHIRKAFCLLKNDKISLPYLVKVIRELQRAQGFVTSVPDDLYQKLAKFIQTKPPQKKGFLSFLF